MQKRMFPAIPGIDFLGKRYGQPELAWAEQVRDALCRKHCFDFAPDDVHAILRRHGKAGDGRLRVLSNESLTGELWRANIDCKRNADRIKQTFPTAKILIVVRRQISHLESLYKQYLLTGGLLPMTEFLTANTHHLQFDISSLCYDRLVEYYIGLFGRERVEVLPYELMSDNAQAFSDAVCDFCEAPKIVLTETDRDYVRRGYTVWECKFVRRLNAWRKSTFNPVGFFLKPNVSTASKLGRLNPFVWVEKVAAMAEKFFGKGELLNSDEKARLVNHFLPGNQRLSKFFPILARYGYDEVP